MPVTLMETQPCTGKILLYKTSNKVHTALQRRKQILKGRDVTKVNLNHMSDNSTGRTADISHLCACLTSSVSEYFCCHFAHLLGREDEHCSQQTKAMDHCKHSLTRALAKRLRLMIHNFSHVL